MSRSNLRLSAPLVAALALACSGGDSGGTQASPANDASSPITDASASGVDSSALGDDASAGDASQDAGAATGDGGGDASSNACAWSGAPGECIAVTACAAMTNHTSESGECPGPATIQCCIETPSTANNPPTPAGYKLMQQSEVTTDMTTWAVTILDHPATYPMFSTTTKVFGTLTVLARVEWHPPDFQNGVIHRGVTLYEPV